MEPVKQAQKKYGTRAMAVAVAAGFFFILLGYKPVGKGLILGTIFSVLNFVLIAQALPLRLSQPKRKAFFFSTGSIVFRYAILALPLVLAVKLKALNLPAVIFGVFMIQVVILADHLVKITMAREKQA